MSRYACAGNERRYRLVVGWDRALAGFFAQVEDLAFESQGAIVDEDAVIGDTPEEGLLVWVGADQQIHELEQIVKAVEAYGSIPQDILEMLRRDQVQASGNAKP